MLNLPKREYYKNFKKSFLPISLVLSIFEYFFSYKHEFLQSDNRHYSFYYFSKILENDYLRFGKLIYCSILTTILVSKFLLKNMEEEESFLKSPRLSVVISFIICLSLVLVPAKLFEFRYLALGYSLLLLLTSYYHYDFFNELTINENFAFQILINCVTLYVFIAKPFVNKFLDNQISRFMW